MSTPQNHTTTEDLTDTAAESPPTQTVVAQECITLGVAGEQVQISESVIGAAAAGQMTANESLIVVAAAGSLGGQVRVLFDAPAALLLGVGFGAALAIVGRLLRRNRSPSSTASPSS